MSVIEFAISDEVKQLFRQPGAVCSRRAQLHVGDMAISLAWLREGQIYPDPVVQVKPVVQVLRVGGNPNMCLATVRSVRTLVRPDSDLYRWCVAVVTAHRLLELA